jgi:ATP-dependent DNA helicase DinG
LENCYKRCGDLLERLETVLQVSPEETVRWFEARPSGFTLSVTPLDVANTFRARTERYCSGWVLTSATLAVESDFTHFAARLGLADIETLQLDSPFDFARNALLYHPRKMPDPGSGGYFDAIVDAVLPVLEASRGRAFILFTSHRALRAVSKSLMGRCRFPLLTQGSTPKRDLLQQFRALGNAVLLGTASFWEGVDVRGDALSCVVIDKLPFAAPGDPVLGARIEVIRGNGGDPFMEYQLPSAIIALKQGVGRLIRDVDDRGVLVLCDPRLTTRSYGRVFLSSLPPMPRTDDIEEVFRFFGGSEVSSVGEL